MIIIDFLTTSRQPAFYYFDNFAPGQTGRFFWLIRPLPSWPAGPLHILPPPPPIPGGLGGIGG